ncbi:MAG: glycosyltransferase family 2 protein [Dinoroseobacter sp.]|nr:glycosyltransferase family 2 protein [Dinoroseobacter sp.]
MVAETLAVDICICTYRRPHLKKTLESLREIDLPQCMTVRILVADNDAEPSARSIIDGVNLPFEIIYLHAPARNISIARNACLDASDAEFVAWIDDDEVVDPGWLLNLSETLRQEGYDAVFGPAIAVYPADAPRHIAEGDFHSNRPVLRHGEVRTGHTCNAMVDMRRAATRVLRFNVKKGRTGGEDTDYFHRLWRTGARMGICSTAEVYEDVTPTRLSSDWLMRRSFNSGHVFGELSRQDARLWALPQLVLAALLKAGYCLVRALASAGVATRRLWWLRRGVMHLGVMAGLVKLTPKTQY